MAGGVFQSTYTGAERKVGVWKAQLGSSIIHGARSLKYWAEKERTETNRQMRMLAGVGISGFFMDRSSQRGF